VVILPAMIRLFMRLIACSCLLMLPVISSVPLNALLLSTTCCSWGNLKRSLGTSPVSCPPVIDIEVRDVKVVNQSGATEALNVLLLKSTTFNLVMLLRSGSDPVSRLLAKFSSFRFTKLLRLGGTAPAKPFLSSRRT